MTEPEIQDPDIIALQEWLRGAWQRLADPTLTSYTRRELRNQMKQWGADLRVLLQAASQRPRPVRESPSFDKPPLRILA